MRIGVGRGVIPCVLISAALVALGGGTGQARAQSTASLTCSVTTDVLSPPDGSMVNVGLSVTPSGFSGTVTYTLAVYSNQPRPRTDDGDSDGDDGPVPADATWDGSDPTTLQLRAGLVRPHPTGRVYLILITATDGTNTASAACTVVVPRNDNKRELARTTTLGAWAENFAERNNFTAPPSFVQLL